MRVLGDDGQRVAGRDEEAAAEDEVAVAVAVAGRAEVCGARAGHRGDEIGGVREVRVGVVAAEVFERHGVDDSPFGRAESLFEDVAGVGAGDGAHRVEGHAEAAREEGAQLVEVEQLLHHRRVV
ncbi:MAG TPA: hypothetical protein VE360_13060, partial [Pyrinomonadaceae bacterium]|nr:hypothetical protein [Pyrinomonadaceae bacterium]